MAAHVRDHGLTLASLRPLAQAAGTSDRMLIHHFGSKDGLVRALLAHLARDLIERLDAGLPEGPMAARREVLMAVLALLRSPLMATHVRIWREITAAAGLGSEPHRLAGQVVVQGLVDLLERRMPETEPDAYRAAEAMLVAVEGIHVADAVGRSDVAEAAIGMFFGENA